MAALGKSRKRVDHSKAQAMLDAGATVLQVAHALKVSQQAVYQAIAAGHITRSAGQS